MAKVSIIIPTFNRCDKLLKPCLESILRTTDLTDVEIIVVANGCTDNTVEYVKSLSKDITLIVDPNPLGYSKATNLGLKASSGEFIVCLNNDTIIQDGSWLAQLQKPFQNDSKMGVVGPIMHTEVGLDFIIFFCACISRKALETVGLLDESFGIGGMEDVDFCHRAKLAGFNIATTDGQRRSNFPIIHYGEQTVWDLDIGRDGWERVFTANQQKLAEKWNLIQTPVIPPRESGRYTWAAKNIVGNTVLELGCNFGYGVPFLKDIPNLQYLGIDNDEANVNKARNLYGADNVVFAVDDVHNRLASWQTSTDKLDTILVFEVLEHLEDGKEFIQQLKNHCKCLLVSTPYKETPGFWGPDHKLHNLIETDFPDFELMYQREDGTITDTPDQFNGLNLMILKWEDTKTYPAPKVFEEKLEKGVTAFIPTKGRYNTTLPLAIMSVINQTVKVKKLIIYDDGEHKDLRQEALYNYLFKTIEFEGIKWEVIWGPGRGQVAGHQQSIDKCTTEWIWRIDDDNVAEPNVLEELLAVADENTGAVGGLVIDPTMNFQGTLASNKIEDIDLGLNEQWFVPSCATVKSVDHLYSTFIYRKVAAIQAGGYCMDLSPKGHREETLLTYSIYRSGWKVLFNPKAKTLHYRMGRGGIRS